MAVVSVTNTFTSLTPAVASEVNRNFTDVVDFVNGDTVHRDGSRPFTGEVSMGSHKITNVLGGVSANDAVNVAQLGGALPAGFIGMYGSDVAPSAAWLLCDGAAYSRTAYPNLFAAIGTSYGAGDGATTFNVPDLNSRFPFGASAGTTGGSNDAVVVSHEHEMGSHTHTSAAHTHTTGTHKHGVDDHEHTMPSHSHTLNKHKHSINHNHGSASTGTQSANHTHHSGSPVVAMYGSGALGFGTNKPLGIPLNVVNGTDLVGNQTASHTHSFNMPNFTGTSGEPSTANTSEVDPGNTNSKTGLDTKSVSAGTTNSTTPGATGSTDPGDTNSTGVAGTGLNRPAFVGVNFIIKSGL
jgi:microcystin-dependent protein